MFLMICAVGETRTPKELLPLVPETNASTNFATTAFFIFKSLSKSGNGRNHNNRRAFQCSLFGE